MSRLALCVCVHPYIGCATGNHWMKDIDSFSAADCGSAGGPISGRHQSPDFEVGSFLFRLPSEALQQQAEKNNRAFDSSSSRWPSPVTSQFIAVVAAATAAAAAAGDGAAYVFRPNCWVWGCWLDGGPSLGADPKKDARCLTNSVRPTHTQRRTESSHKLRPSFSPAFLFLRWLLHFSFFSLSLSLSSISFASFVSWLFISKRNTCTAVPSDNNNNGNTPRRPGVPRNDVFVVGGDSVDVPPLLLFTSRVGIADLSKPDEADSASASAAAASFIDGRRRRAAPTGLCSRFAASKKKKKKKKKNNKNIPLERTNKEKKGKPRRSLESRRRRRRRRRR